MKRRSTILPAALLTGAIGMSAAGYGPETGIYVGGAAGFSVLRDADLVSGGTNLQAGFAEWDAAWSGALGYDAGKWRVEIEGAWRSNEGENVLSDGVLYISENSYEQRTLMLNGYWDNPVGKRWTFSLGAGLGAAFTDLTMKAANTLDDSDTALAYQAMLGMSYRVTERLDVGAEYRFVGVTGPSYAIGANSYDMENIQNHGVFAAVRFNFGEIADAPRARRSEPAAVTPPAPAAAPEVSAPASAAQPADGAAPQPAPVRDFIVYFDFDRAGLTGEAQTVLREAAAAILAGQNVAVTVVGHTDTVGSAAYNQRLSERRAAAVKQGLVRMGVPAESISASGRGFREPAVDSGPGVKEPRNRRAVINF